MKSRCVYRQLNMYVKAWPFGYILKGDKKKINWIFVTLWDESVGDEKKL